MNHIPLIPYGRQVIDEEDITAVVEVLRSDWLTTGPAVEKFEADVCAYTGARYGVAVSSGTAALHATLFALGIEKDDEVIVTPLTFAASVNCILYQGGSPVFVDVDPQTLLLDPVAVEAAVTPRTRAIIAVDYAGHPCDWNALRNIASKYHLALVDDACHALGAEYKGQKIGTLADITVFSFHPVKHITTGEGGMAVTNDNYLAERMRCFRNHGITTTATQREKSGAWFYEMTELGFNYRITDFQCALGSSQLKKLDGWLEKRTHIAQTYDKAFAKSVVQPIGRKMDVRHAYHLYVVRVPNRDLIFKMMRQNGIGANVHYIPVYLHPYYIKRMGTHKGICQNAEKAFQEIITLPLWPELSQDNIEHIKNIILNSNEI